MYYSTVILVFLSFQVFTRGVNAITCIAMTGGTCTGATYCTSQWNKQANGSWIPFAQGCLTTSMVQKNLNKWQMPTPTILTIVCSANNCNGAPMGNLPTSPPVPGYVQCISPFARTKHCTSQSCVINMVNNVSAQMCASNGKENEKKKSFRTIFSKSISYLGSSTSYLLQTIPKKTFCSRTIFELWNGKVAHTGCYCGNMDNCNTKDLLTTGMNQLNNLPSISCSLGPAGTAKGQLCLWQSTTVGNTTRITRMVSSYTTEAVKPQLAAPRPMG